MADNENDMRMFQLFFIDRLIYQRPLLLIQWSDEEEYFQPCIDDLLERLYKVDHSAPDNTKTDLHYLRDEPPGYPEDVSGVLADVSRLPTGVREMLSDLDRLIHITDRASRFRRDGGVTSLMCRYDDPTGAEAAEPHTPYDDLFELIKELASRVDSM